MDEIALSFEESVDVIGEITRNLRHPQSIRSASDSANLDPPRRQLHKEKDDEPLQAARRPDFYCKEVTGHDLIPMSAEELLPSYLPASFRSPLDAMSFQDVRNRVVCQYVTQIGKCSLYPSISPGSILFRHPHNQRGDFLSRSPSSKCSRRSAIILLRNQFPVPSHQCFWSHDGRHLCQQPPTKLFRPCSQPPALIVAESQTAIANLFSKNSILLDQIFKNLSLANSASTWILWLLSFDTILRT